MSIIITKKDESFLTIECDMGIAMELSDAFSFLVPGHKYMLSYRQGKFDGFIRLFNLGRRTLPLGLFDKLKDFCAERNYEYTVKDSRFGIPGETAGITYEETDEYIKTLGLDTRTKPIDVRDYQIQGVHVWLNNYRAIALASVGCLDPNTIIDVQLDEEALHYLNEIRV